MPVDPALVRARISDVRLSVNELRRLTSRPFSELDVDQRYSMRYNLIALVESLVSLCTHLCMEAYGKTPTSYREAIKCVAERLTLSCVKDLQALVGFRNLLIHRYWTVDDERVYREILDDFKCVEEFLYAVEEAFTR
ncbi:hypothetical protein CSUB_C0298 [Candidatus Caldarchaeum subterraneum]|uniref:DUF86 domain-containing protein n=1 Tax=Caldiarchaeum subterraneum TaxID=311458 RepID=E6N4V4_CALS0|nr:hypothetical protein HGMM_F36E03C05 [Candidatus Caldarchaeum subterraneum]BAJ47342.1 hypothetical protein HGMM_F27H06C11 [Candidatus Caldarchaeum subterraneum]BAJ49166.1 hypothetical protein HGMM_F51A06C07 [Candidatus Caldarchaeum subterraneum]BAJ50159.1 hypothetical protein CSUB_C0298 [Candidatus Caldarchaeum subterraneum]